MRVQLLEKYEKTVCILIPILYLFCTHSQMRSLLDFFWAVLYLSMYVVWSTLIRSGHKKNIINI